VKGGGKKERGILVKKLGGGPPINPGGPPGFPQFPPLPIYVLYAVAMIGIGMLSHTGNNVAMDSFGPISDNANGIAEWHGRGRTMKRPRKPRQIMG